MLVDFVKAREGYATDNGDGTATAYWDTAGKVWTIGWGTTGPNVVEGTTWTVAQCEAALVDRLNRASTQLHELSTGILWPPGAEDALTDFIYNEGAGHYASSTLRRRVETEDWAAVRTELQKWEFAGGKKLAGLVSRREGEAAMIDA